MYDTDAYCELVCNKPPKSRHIQHDFITSYFIEYTQLMAEIDYACSLLSGFSSDNWKIIW